MTVFQNDNFEVRTFQFGPSCTEMHLLDVDGRIFDEYYEVINRGTGIVEYKTPGIVDAIVYAHNTDHMLKNKPWEWVDKAQTDAEDWSKTIKRVPPEEAN